MAAITRQNLFVVGETRADQSGADSMKMLTSADLFAPPKRERRNKDWLERARLVLAAARDRAAEMAQQRAERVPTVLQRRRRRRRD
jgi:hypothetical protein